MKAPRLFAATAALVAMALSASACDSSPYAAQVNSQVIKQTALNAELREWASNSAYVTAFDQSGSSSGVTVAGDGPGTFNSSWVADILGQMINSAAVHQHLVATNSLPSPGMIAAARALGEFSQIGWLSFSPSFRDTLTNRLAEEAALSVPSVPVNTLRQVYENANYNKYFFTEICTLQATTSTLAAAQTLATQRLTNGTPICYDQASFENQSTDFQKAVLGLAAGKVAPVITTKYGYLVVQVQSRTVQEFTPDVQRVLSAAIVRAEGQPNQALTQLLSATKVRINPAYGSWANLSVSPPPQPTANS